MTWSYGLRDIASTASFNVELWGATGYAWGILRAALSRLWCAALRASNLGFDEVLPWIASKCRRPNFPRFALRWSAPLIEAHRA